MAVKAVFFDVGETLVDETRYWAAHAERLGVTPHVVWAALGATISRGEHHRHVFELLGGEPTEEVVGRVLEPLGEGWDAAVPGLPIADTVKRVRGDEVIETVPREDLVTVQTPQAFVAAVLRRAAAADEEASDCAALVERAGGRVKIVPGDPRLLKVTDAADLDLVASWL